MIAPQRGPHLPHLFHMTCAHGNRPVRHLCRRRRGFAAEPELRPLNRVASPKERLQVGQSIDNADVEHLELPFHGRRLLFLR